MKIVVTDECMQMIRFLASRNFDDSGAVRTFGGWELEIGDETADRLTALREPGESLSDVIVRAMSAMSPKH